MQGRDNLDRDANIEDLLTKTLEETRLIVEQMRDTVSRELVSRNREFIVYSGICKRDEVELIQDGLTLVLPQDKTKRSLELGVVRKATEKGISIVVDELFLMRDDVSFLSGKLITNFREFQVRFRLQRKMDYEKEIEKMQELFYKNRVSFQPLYTPYFYKFYYVVLEPVRIEWKAEEVLERIEVDKHLLEGCFEENMVPVWNITRRILHNHGERIFVQDGIYYHYEFDRMEEANGILIDYEDRKTRHIGVQIDGKIVIETDEEALGDEWISILFQNIGGENLMIGKYPVVSNHTKDKFIGRYGGYFGTPVLSFAEIQRKINSYIDTGTVEFIDAEIVNEVDDYDTFSVPGSQIYGIGDCRPYLVLHFRTTKEREWLAKETMSFLAATVGQEFQAYQVVGRLVDKQ